MIIDKNGKLFGKINIIDLLVILLIIGAGIGFGLRFVSTAADNVRSQTKLTYVVEVENIRSYAVDALQKKGIATDTKTKNIIGEIVDVSASAMKTQALKADGTTVFAEVPGKYSARVTVTADGRESDRGYFVGENIELSVGSSVSLSTKYVNTSGKVISITKGE